MLPIALSPCPNDTYLFYPWLKGLVGRDLPLKVTYADIDTLNRLAIEGAFDLIKLSMYCYAQVQERYEMLTSGMALGKGVGPKIIGKRGRKIAIPGKETTAHFLTELFWKEELDKVFCTYDQVLPLLRREEVDLGVVIHETRFTFEQEGFLEVADLGALWEQKFSLPLPLGGIAIKRGHPYKEKIVTLIKESYEAAKKNPPGMYEYILDLSQEKNKEVVEKHIALYVNEETYSLSNEGKQAVERFLSEIDCVCHTS